MSGRWKLGQAGWICILLVLAVWAVYLPVVGFEFTNYDDPDYVTKNPPVRAGLKWESVVWAFTHSHSANWHPLTWLTHMVDCQLFGLRAGGHHLTNLLLHTANTVLLFGLLRSLTGAVWRSGLVAALFGLHPTHVESVAWVAERKDVLSTCFGLLTLWAYVVYARGSRCEEARIGPNVLGEKDQRLLTSSPATRKWYALSLVCYALGLMSKPMLVTLPFVMLLLDYWPLGRFTSHKGHWRRIFVEKLPFFALAAGSCVVTAIVQEAHKAVSSLAQSPLGFRFANAAISYVLYIGKLIWPTRLAVIYPEVHNWPVYVVVLALGFLGMITLLACWQRERRPWLLMGWLWFVGMLVPVIGIVKVGSHQIADRYTYLPSIGFFIMAVWGAAEFLRWPATVWLRRGLAGAAILLCMVLAQAQVMQWRNTETLFRHALSVTRGNWAAYTILAFDLVAKKEPGEAEKCLRASLEANPLYEPAWTKLATLVVEEGRLQEGVGYCQKALGIDPSSAGAHSTWGVALIRQGQTNEAMAHYEKALRCEPNFADAHYNLGNALANQGQIALAREHYEAAIEKDPYSADYHNNLAYMLVREGKLDRAVKEFHTAVELEPESWHARYGLGDVLVRQGHYADGAAQLEQVLEVQPELASARLQYGIALAAQGQVTRAVAAFSEAVRRKPDFALAHYHLGRLLNETGKFSEAAQHYREAVKLVPNFADALNRLAWLLSVSSNAALRNGPEAIELAEQACKLSNNAQPAMVRTLAAAYAEAGRFDDAVKTAEKACGTMAAVPQEEQKCQQMLMRFRAGQPWREGPTENDASGKR